jgi:hypothetical protein
MRKLTEMESLRLKSFKGKKAVFRVTKTILDKSIQDANADIRKALKEAKILDYGELAQGSKVVLEGFHVSYGVMTDNKRMKVPCKISCYKANGRGDKRIWFSDLKKYAEHDSMMVLLPFLGKIKVVNITNPGFYVKEITE